MDPKQPKKQHEPKEDIKGEVKEPVADIKPDESETMKKEVEEYKHRYLRALADYQNLEKRMLDDRKKIQEDATRSMLLQLIPFLDQLNQAEIFFKDPGLKMIKQQYEQLLEEMGIEEIEVMGKEFDPYVAEAIDVVEGEKDNIVMEVMQRGYKFKERVLRPAQVKVSKKKETS